MNNDLRPHAVIKKLVKNLLNPLFGIELDLSFADSMCLCKVITSKKKGYTENFKAFVMICSSTNAMTRILAV